MNYKEVYATLNTVQLRKLGSIIDMALRTRLSAYEVMLFLSKSDIIKLNNDQFELFWVIVKYIVKNREHIKEVIYEAMKKEFFDSMDRLIAEQHTISPISNGSNALDVKLDNIDETDLYFANHKED